MRILASAIIFLFLCVFMLGCHPRRTGGHIVVPAPHVIYKPVGHGPPPHAPAHGYRHKHPHGVNIMFDSGLGVYVVVEMAGVYFHNGLYLRFMDDHWESAAHFKGPWGTALHEKVPPKLKKSKLKKKKKKHPGKGRGKGKIIY